MRLKKEIIPILCAIVLLIGYFGFELYTANHVALKTQTATMTTVYEKIDTTALVVRDEQAISGSASGVTVPCVSDGDKVKVGGNVAMTFDSSESAQKFAQYQEAQKQLNYYMNLEDQTVGQVASVESIDSEIADKVDDYIRYAATGKTADIGEKGNEVNDGILRRQMLIGENVNLVSIIQELRQQSESLTGAKPSGYITTEQSGVFTSYADGLEKTADFAKAPTYSIQEVKALSKQYDKTGKTDGCIGKLVTSYRWYLLCAVDANSVKELQNGSKVDVALKDSDDTVIRMTIADGAEPVYGAKQTVLVLTSSEMNPKIASLRKEEIEIRKKAVTGIRVPAAALHVRDGKKGVYALLSNSRKFREVKVIYTDGDDVIVEYDPNKTGAKGIRLYDKVIIQGKELGDG